MGLQSKARRGRCRYCGRSFALRKNGKIRKHNQKGSTVLCGGSDQVPS